MTVHQQLRDTAEHITSAASWPDALTGIATGFDLVERAAHGMGDTAPLGGRTLYTQAEILAAEARQTLNRAPGRMRAEMALAADAFPVEAADVDSVRRSAADLADAMSRRLADATDDSMTTEELLAFGDAWLAADRLQLMLAREADDGDVR